MSEEHHTDQPETVTVAPKKRHRLRRFVVGVTVLLLLLAGLTVWLATTVSGLHTALFRLPALFGVHITAEKTEGTFWQGFSAKNLLIRTASSDITLKSFVLDWQSQELRQNRLLHIRLLELGEMTILSTGSSASSSSSPKMPKDIGLPFDVKIDRAVSNGILWGKNKDIILSSAELNYTYLDNQHTLNVRSLNTPWGHAEGAAKLINAAPFAADGQLALKGFINKEAAEGGITLAGNLQDLLLAANLGSANMVIDADAQLSPFADNAVARIHHATLNVGNVNPQDFWKSAPAADLTLFADIRPTEQADVLEGNLVLANAIPQPADRDGIPISIAYAILTVDPEGVVAIKPFEAEFLHQGKIALTGTISDKLDLNAQISALTIADLLAGKPTLPLNGTVTVTGMSDAPDIRWQAIRGALSADGLLTVRTAGKKRERTLTLEKALLSDGAGGSANLSGKLEQFGKETAKLLFTSKNFNPAVFGADYPQGKVNGKISLDGTLAHDPELTTQIDFKNSHLSGMPLIAQGKIDYRDAHITPSKLNVSLGTNRIAADGTFGKKGDKLNLNINAPSLAQFGFGLTGALNAQGFIAGDIRSLNTRLSGSANGFAFRDWVKLQQLRFDLTASPDIHAPLNIDIKGNNLILSGTHVDHATITAQGTLARHSLNANAALTAEGKPYRADIAAQGGMDEQYQWSGTVARFNTGGTLNVLLENPVRLSISEKALNLGAARWRALGGTLNLQSLSWQKKAGFATSGQANGIHLAELENIITLPVKQDLVLAGDWDVQYNENARGSVNLRRVSGDIVLPGRTQTLGLNQLTLETHLSAGRILNTLHTETRFGHGTANLDIAQNFGDNILKAPINGDVKIIADDLGRIKYLLPVGLDLGGTLQTDIKIRGALGDPLLSGSLNAQKLAYHDLNNGIRLDNGELTSHFDGKKWLIDSLLFTHADGGTLEVKGNVARVGALPDVNLDVLFARYPVLNRPDQQVVLSGGSQIHYADQTGLALTGELTLDKALFDFPKASMPALGDDVVVLGAPPKQENTPMLLALNLVLNLNDAFRFSGKGLNVLMGGQLTLTAKPRESVKLLGMVNVVEGRYKAYGQDLEVERGNITFIGPIENPLLNIRARRRMSPVGAGVEVTGSANQPRAVLIANSPMSDKDKLAWLVLGRAAAGESDNAALAAAAGTWLAGGINDKVGLVDDIGLTSRAVRNPDTGEMNPAEQMITVGKHLSARVYLGYEYGISSATQAVKLVYQLSKTVQLIGRVGSDSAGGEIRYSKRFD